MVDVFPRYRTLPACLPSPTPPHPQLGVRFVLGGAVQPLADASFLLLRPEQEVICASDAAAKRRDPLVVTPPDCGFEVDGQERIGNVT